MMDQNPIITISGKVTDEIFLIDLYQYNIPRTCSAFILQTSESTVIMDTGTNNDVSSVLEFMKNNALFLKKVNYLVPSHYHFDHFGGGSKLWETIKEVNPEVKILTVEETKKRLQDHSSHVKRAKRTFSGFVGTMEPLPAEAFEIVDPDEPILIPGMDGTMRFELISTPGHTTAHVSPTFFKNNKPEFMYLGEAAGSLLHLTKLVTLSTSMPPDFKFNSYMTSLEKIIDLKPKNTGYGHFGAVKCKVMVMQALRENREFSYFFRDYVKEKFTERAETRYVVEQFMTQELRKRTDFPNLELYTNMIVAVVYGQLVDLGLRKLK
ncbi:MAG: MBL fold metallo-hydrolase [Candidatus Heimdallarchaeota archaeon]